MFSKWFFEKNAKRTDFPAFFPFLFRKKPCEVKFPRRDAVSVGIIVPVFIQAVEMFVRFRIVEDRIHTHIFIPTVF